MQPVKSHRLVFLIPILVLLLGLIAVSTSKQRLEQSQTIRVAENFETDAALRSLIRDMTGERLLMLRSGFESRLEVNSPNNAEDRLEIAWNGLIKNYRTDSASQLIHFFIAKRDAQGRVLVAYSYPRSELVGQDISGHTMLDDFDWSGPPGQLDQMGFRASRENDLSFTSEAPVIVRRQLLQFSSATETVVWITKFNLVDMDRFFDSLLRDVGPLAQLDSSLYDPASNTCLLRYRAGVGELPCDDSDFDGLVFVSERNGFRIKIQATDAYLTAQRQQYPAFALSELALTLFATAIAFFLALLIRSRLLMVERQVGTYKGALASKEQLTSAIHTVVSQNLAQLSDLTRRAKNASNTAETEERYFNIALSEIIQLRLNLDASIIADRAREHRTLMLGKGQSVQLTALAKRIQVEFERLARDEDVTCRVLVDEVLALEIEGSEYWLETALLAFIMAALSFVDEGFVELALWTETSVSGKPELMVRIRDTGIGWSLDDPELDHTALNLLQVVLLGLGATMSSTVASEGKTQEHIIRFNCP